MVTTNSLTNGQNDDVQLLPSGNQQTEVHISIDKTNPSNLIASANVISSSGFSTGYYYSLNRGLSWTGSDYLPNGGQSSGDPSTAYDAGGTAYLANMSPSIPVNQYLVQSSVNKGVSWTNQIGASTLEDAGTEFDKEMVAADDIASSPNANTLYTAWTVFDMTTSASTLKFNHSTDRLQSVRGQAFSTPIVLLPPSAAHDTGVNVQTGPTGEVYVCWADYPNRRGGAATGVGFARSTDGGTTFTTTPVAFGRVGIEDQGTQPDPLFNNTRVNDFPAMAVDKGTTHPGRIYITYTTKENNSNIGKAIIQVRHSDDKGITWSSPVSISSGSQNWFPWIAADDATGDVSVVYYSFDTSTQFQTNTYIAYSRDGGNSFCQLKVSDVPHTPTAITATGTSLGYAGDYIGITAYNGRAYPTWADNRSGTWQLYTSPVATSAFIIGPAYLLAGTTGTYTIPDKPANSSSINWTSSNTSIATINSSGVATAGCSTGSVTFTGAYYTSCGPNGNLTKTVQVGTEPTGTYYYNGTQALQTTNFIPSPTRINMTLDGPYYYAFSSSDPAVPVTSFDGLTAYFDMPASGGVTITATATNSPCSNVVGSYAFAPGGYAYSVAPNPASSQLVVTTSNPAGDPPFEADLYDGHGRQVKTQHSALGKAVLDVRELPDGLYVLRAGQGKKAISEHIQIIH